MTVRTVETEFYIESSTGVSIYRVYKKKLNKFEIALNVAKRLKV